MSSINFPCMASPAPGRTFMKDLQQLSRTIDASTDGQASIDGIDEMTVKVSLRPKAGFNAHAEFLVTIECCATYPRSRPTVTFNTPILHPNIDAASGSVCLSILDGWQSCYSLIDLVKAILYLIAHPIFHSPYIRIRPYCGIKRREVYYSDFGCQLPV
ncbi:Ubiquitin-conjugating enzyme E2 PEX4 [Taenia crassiceps]|uniref:Ubiquitin-conjugating enzyme E2 PEX4 n=1 Tax=Taenia crassiceps TaxID=6207 RepID=A0ABR4QAJ3_9CEST